MEELGRALQPLRRQLRLLASRAVLKLMKDAVSVQVKALDGEPKDDAELFQQYGFRSRPLAGAEGIMLALGGTRDHTVILCMDDRRYQVDLLKNGEVAMYTDEEDYFVLKRGRIAELNTKTFVVKASEKVRFETPMVENTGEIKDKCDSGGVTMADMRTKHNAHDHNETNVAGGKTSKPNQVF